MTIKSNLGRAVGFIAILLLVALAGAVRAHAQGTGPLLPTRNSLTAVTDMHGPAIGEEFTELAAGVFTYSKTDLSLPGPMPINITRVYRSEDITSGSWNNRAFGVGTRLNYDIFVYTSGSNEYVSMPDSSYLTCTPSGSEYVCNSEPSGVWFGSTISGSTLTRPDGTIYRFAPATGLLVSITDRFNNSITISRGSLNGSQENSACQTGAGLVPDNYVGTVSSSNGRAVYFCYDDQANNPDDITGIADNAGPIKKVTYTYNSGSTLATVTQVNYDSHAKTTYQYGQTSPYARGDITTIIVNDSCPSSGGCGSPNQVFTYITYMTDGLGTVLASISSQLPGNGYTYDYNSPGTYPASHVTVSLPDNATRDFHFDSAGYVYKDVRNVNAANPEYTFFDRGHQTVGQSAEFVGEVDEDDSNGTTVLRKTTYNYDTNAGTVKSVTLSPAPGQTSCCTTSATWNYTYTTFNRIASFAEPLSYNSVETTYSYVDPPSTPSMTVTDSVGNQLTTTYNAQGQPVSIPNALGNLTTVQYYSTGDVQWVKDPLLNQTTYVTDADGRVIQVTSPLQEITHYAYDAIDDVTQVTDPLNHITCNTYDLIGELASTTPPKGVTSGSCTSVNSAYTTKIGRNPNLAKTTVTDPLGYTTVTNLDGQGRKTDYTDKRNFVTTYTYNKFGEVTEAFFNQNNKSGYAQEKVDMSNFDALDRVGQITETVNGNTQSTQTFAYDSLNSPMSITDTANNASPVSYDYDKNGRRTSMTVTLNGVAQTPVNYGYDCDDRLIGMSNNGTAIQSCSPTFQVTNGDSSTQFAFYYEGAGVLEWMLADGVLTWDIGIDNDARITERDYYSYPGFVQYGADAAGHSLTYAYDPDGHVIDKGGGLAAVNIPAAASASYSTTDQVTVWNTASTSPDHASNITSDPSGLTLTWNARNQLSGISNGTSEKYDGLGRRESATLGSSQQSFQYDGSTMIGWSIPYIGTYNFLTLPEGGALAGTYNGIGTPGTYVPLIDTDGSTIGLVNAASVDAGPVATYTYDPSGNPTVTGGNYWPFQYKGMEKEFTDPGPYYYSGGGQFYSPQMARSLSEVGQTSSSGPGGGPSGNSIGAPSGSSGSGINFPSSVGAEPENSSEGQTGRTTITVTGAAGAGATIGAIIGAAVGNPLAGAVIGGAIGAIVGGIASVFDDLFGGGGAPPTPRQLLHGRHPLYPVILGVPDGLITDEASAGLKICGDPQPSSAKPLDKVDSCREELRACQQQSSGRALTCAKSDLMGALTLGAGCFPLCAGTGPAAPECLGCCETGVGFGATGGLMVCGGIRLGGSLNCLVQYSQCRQGM